MTLHNLPTKNRQSYRAPHNRQRGSTILLVLAMLSILLLLAIAFSYGTRLESQASYNYAELAQARVSAASGLPMAAPMLAQASLGITSPLQDWNTVPAALDKAMDAKGNSAISATQMASLKAAGISLRRDSKGSVESGPQATLQVRDLSGLVNINAIPNADVMTRLVNTVVPGGDVRQRSAALLALRGETPASLARRQNARGTSRSVSQENLDPRKAGGPALDNLARLRVGLNTGKPLFSDEEIKKLDQFITVFSQAPEMFNAGDGTHLPKISLSDINPTVVFTTLKRAFPQKKRELLLQFAANLADFSDEDDEPTVLDMQGQVITLTAGAPLPAGITIGVEKTPVISEVYPDSASGADLDDDGQFVEIVNPWDEDVNLGGWTLRTGTAGSVPLNGILPAGGYLVVTDNLDSPKPDSPVGKGSLVSIFGAAPDGSMRRVITVSTFNLQDRNSQVSLHNSRGQLVDVFAYGAGNAVDGKASFQRPDPLVRGWKIAEATPLLPAAVLVPDANARTVWQDGNSTITRISQLFQLSTGFVENAEGGQMVHGSQVASVTLPDDAGAAGEPYPTNLDLRLVDVFTAATPDEATTAALEDKDDRRSRKNRGAEEMKAFRERLARIQNGQSADAADTGTTSAVVYSYGKLNLNTCSKYALLGLDLGSAATAQGGVAGLIEQFEGHRLTRTQQGKAAFLNVSDFIRAFVPGVSRSNLKVLDSITDQVTVGSSSFEVTATNRLSTEQRKALESGKSIDGPRPATATAKWVISLDQQPYSILSFTLVP